MCPVVLNPRPVANKAMSAKDEGISVRVACMLGARGVDLCVHVGVTVRVAKHFGTTLFTA